MYINVVGRYVHRLLSCLTGVSILGGLLHDLQQFPLLLFWIRYNSVYIQFVQFVQVSTLAGLFAYSVRQRKKRGDLRGGGPQLPLSRMIICMRFSTVPTGTTGENKKEGKKKEYIVKRKTRASFLPSFRGKTAGASSGRRGWLVGGCGCCPFFFEFRKRRQRAKRRRKAAES